MKNEKPAMEQSIANLVGEHFHQMLLDALPCAAFIITTLTHEITVSNQAAKKTGVYADVGNSWFSLRRFTPDKFNEGKDLRCSSVRVCSCRTRRAAAGTDLQHRNAGADLSPIFSTFPQNVQRGSGDKEKE